MTATVAAILLAAGQSRRMGSCKQLLPLGRSSVLDRCLDTLLAGGITAIVVVVSPQGAAVAEAARRYPVSIVVNPLIDGDMASSLRAGREAFPTTTSGVIIALCDYPLVLPTTVTRLVREHIAHPDKIIIPCHGGQRGHPLLFPRPLLAELATEMTLRDLVRAEPARIFTVEVTDPGILQDMDTPEDYQHISRLLGG